MEKPAPQMSFQREGREKRQDRILTRIKETLIKGLMMTITIKPLHPHFVSNCTKSFARPCLEEAFFTQRTEDRPTGTVTGLSV